MRHRRPVHARRFPALSSFQKSESGKRHTNRPQLAAALDRCRRSRATLVIARLDRLARNVHFISGLMESGVHFVAVDMPQANRLTIHILSVPVLIKQDFSNKKFAANYQPGDEIHYKTGSPSAEGIPNNSAAKVLSVDGNKNILTVETREGEQVSYNPAQLRRQTAESAI